MSALLAANRRDLSLADCTSFEILRGTGLDTVLSLMFISENKHSKLS
jgi:hypothetical protein